MKVLWRRGGLTYLASAAAKVARLNFMVALAG